MRPAYKIIGHALCPYVQRVVIAMLESGIPFEKVDIDLDAKPGWLEAVSPFGRVPVLEVDDDTWLFDSSAIAIFIDRTCGGGLLPEDPVAHARQDAWMRFGDGMLSLVARIIYRDPDAHSVAGSMQTLLQHLQEMDHQLVPDPYFSGPDFGLLDAILASLFRSFTVLDRVSEVSLTASLSARQCDWWDRVRRRPSVRVAVPQDYEAAYAAFIAARNSHAGRTLKQEGF